MENEFLLKEYECCYEQLRYYDSRNTSILKYIFSLSTAVATAQFAIFKFAKASNTIFFIGHSFLSIVVFVTTLLLFLSMLQNRLYFIYIAKQINAIRSYYINVISKDFNNQLYTSVNFSAFKLSSVHTFQLLGVSFISSIFAGLSAYSIYPVLDTSPCSIAGFIVFIIVLLAEFIGAVIYLKINGGKKADEAIHKI